MLVRVMVVLSVKRLRAPCRVIKKRGGVEPVISTPPGSFSVATR